MTVQMQVLIHTFGPLQNFCQCLNIQVVWNAFAWWYTVCAMLMYILCTSINCPYIKLLLLHLYGNRWVSVLNQASLLRAIIRLLPHVLIS